MNGAVASIILAGLLSVAGLTVAVLLMRLRAERAQSRRLRREAEEANRALAAFADKAVEDFFRGPDGGLR